jgi:LAO/AO transport system kinase
MLVAGAGRDADPSRAARPRPKRPEVMITTAATGAGVPELLVALDRHRATGRETGDSSASSRLARAEAQVWAVVGDRLRERLHDAAHRDGTAAALAAVADHQLDPYEAADRLLGSLEVI